MRYWIVGLAAVAFVFGLAVPIGLTYIATREASLVVGLPSLVLGGLLAATVAGALLAPSSSELAWRKGAAGERIVGGALDRLAGPGVRVLHDRRIPSSRANIDHLAVTGGGVFTIDAKRYTGRLELRARGSELWVKGRNRSKLLVQAHRQRDVARQVLDQAGFSGVPVTPVLCFVETEMSWLFPPTRAGDVVICRPRGLAKRLEVEDPRLSENQIAAIADALERALLPAEASATPTSARPERPQRHERRPVPAADVAAAVDGSAAAAPVPTCRCWAPMVVRVRRSDGQRFYGCTTYPRCRQTRPWVGARSQPDRGG